MSSQFDSISDRQLQMVAILAHQIRELDKAIAQLEEQKCLLKNR